MVTVNTRHGPSDDGGPIRQHHPATDIDMRPRLNCPLLKTNFHHETEA